MRVPIYDSPQVEQKILPGVRVQPSDAGQQQEAIGNAMQRFGGQVQQLAVEEQTKADMVRVDDALNQTRAYLNTATYDPDTGYMAKRGKDAFPQERPLEQVYGDQALQHVQSVAATLGNERQRQLYMQHAQAAVTNFRGGIQRHSLQEFERYGVATNNATVEIAIDSATRNWNNPATVGEELTRAENAIYKNAELQGVPKDDPLTKTLALKATSAIYSRAVKAALEANDLQAAQFYFNAGSVSGKLAADDILQLQGHIVRQQEIATAGEAIQRAQTQLAPAMAPTDFGRVVNITAGTESGGKQFDASGKTVTSPKGALGRMQVMEGTGPEAAKLAGLPWDANRLKTDEAYNTALGAAYLRKQLQDFGTMDKAWAAYNAGPGRLKSALAAAANPKNEGKPWLDFMPKETQDYVAKNMAQLQAGGGVPKKPTLQDFQQAALDDPAVASNPSPTLRKMVLDNAEKVWRANQAATKQEADEAVMQAQQWFILNPGHTPEDLPFAIRDAVIKKAPSEYDNLGTFARNVVRSQNVQTDPVAWTDAYRKIIAGQPVNVADYLGKLSFGDYKQLVELQAKPEKHLDAVGLEKQLQEAHYLLRFGSSTGDKEKIGMFDMSVINAVQAAQQQAGKPLDYAARKAIIDRMMAPGSVYRSWLWNKSMRAYEAVGTPDEQKFVPDAERAKIKEALTRAKMPVTEENIIRLYHRLNP